MAEYFFRVKDIREAMKGLPGDFPVVFYVDTDALERQHQGLPVLVNTSIVTPTAEERKDREECVGDGCKDMWTHRNEPHPKKYLMFHVG